MNDWLHDLNPGDEVFVTYGLGCFRSIVDKVTKRHVVADRDRFSLKTGKAEAHFSRRLLPITDEECLKQEARALLRDRLKELSEVCSSIEDYRVINNVSATLAAIIAGLKTRTTEDAT